MRLSAVISFFHSCFVLQGDVMISNNKFGKIENPFSFSFTFIQYPYLKEKNYLFLFCIKLWLLSEGRQFVFSFSCRYIKVYLLDVYQSIMKPKVRVYNFLFYSEFVNRKVVICLIEMKE